MTRLPRLPTGRWLLAIVFGMIAVSVGLLFDIAINVVNGGKPPGPLAPYQPLAGPLLGVLFLVSVVAAVREYLADHGPRSDPRSREQPPDRPSASGQLPDDIREFVGRRQDLETLRARAHEHSEAQTSGTVIAISGHIGTGKSVLAIHFAYQLLAQYPDAQLYVDLEGSSPTPLDPAEALDHLVRGLPGGGRGGTASIVGRGDEYRASLRRKRAIIVLDNARNEAQVQPLLPRSPGCLVLVTSRKRLDGLEGARRVPLGDMSDEDAVDLLVRIAGEQLLQGENLEATKEIAALCAHLPLALSIMGARLRGRRAPEIAARLREHPLLPQVQDDERDFQALLDLGYENLAPAERTLFRRLKLLPEASFDARVAAALLDVPVEQAGRMLDELVDAQVLEWAGDGRYGFNDLVGLLARDKLENEEPQRERNAASERALRVYLTDVTGRAAQLDPDLAELAGDDGPGSAALEEQLDALDWFDRERPTLVAVGHQATEIEAHDIAWKLAAALIPFFDVRGDRGDWADLRAGALAAARATDGLEDQAWASLAAGHLDWLEGRYDTAHWHFEEALEYAEAGGWQRLQARALFSMGRADYNGRAIERALESYNRAAAIFADEGMVRAHTSVMLSFAAALHQQGAITDRHVLRLGDSVLAAIAEEPADLWILRTTGWIKEYQGQVLGQGGDLEHAGACCIASEQAYRLIGFRYGQARVLRELGRIRVAQGNRVRARQLLEESVAIFRAIGDDVEANEASSGLREIPPEQAPPA